MVVDNVPRAALTHSQRVCRLYKRAQRLLEDWSVERVEFRYQSVLLRDRFDRTRQEKDVRKLAAMLKAGEEELRANYHPQPFAFKNDPEGILYEREAYVNDMVLDMWHPWEKVVFLDYFEGREKRKEEYRRYFLESILKKCETDLQGAEFPIKSGKV